jgi:hypothetical protein
MTRRTPALAFLTFITAVTLSASSFIVPKDAELVSRSTAIVVGTVEGVYVEQSETDINTVAEVRLERAVKGAGRADELIRVATYGGVSGDRALVVPGAAHFEQGERVLLFLVRDPHDSSRWRTTDLTLGKFRFVTSSKGARLLTRDTDDIEGWDAAGTPHVEKLRKETEFLQSIEQRVRGRVVAEDYLVDPAEVTLQTTPAEPHGLTPQSNATYPPRTYTTNVNSSGTYLPSRWPNMAAGVTMYKRSDQNISGVADGGVSVIQGGMNAWNSECGSVVNLIYGGQSATASANFDTVHVVEFNDPQGRVPGSWTGAGTIAITFISYSGQHSFNNETWWSITDADVVFQDGFPGTHPAFPTAMTHELGHGIGWRHSNAHYISTTGADQPCDPSVEECSTSAIMNATAIPSFGYALQTWDVNAVESVYPGGTCGGTCTPPAITSQTASTSISAGSLVTLTVTATGTANLTYQWFQGARGDVSNPVPNGGSPSVTVAPGTTTNFWARVTNGCGSADSGGLTVTVPVTGLSTRTATKLYLITPCRLIDTRNPNGPQGGPLLAPNSVRTVVAVGQCGIPATAAAIVANIVAVNPTSSGFLAIYPGTGGPFPGTSTLNYKANRSLANNSIVKLSSDGKVSVYNSGPALNFVIDLNGYFQ